MLKLEMFKRILTLVVLVLAFNCSAEAQKDCAYGFNLYVLDETGKTIENAKPEVSGLSKKDILPSAFQVFFSHGAYFVGASMYGSTISGDFLLRVSAEGFETYERRFKFPVCEIQSVELRMRPKGAASEPRFERLFKLHGKVFDEDRRPLANAKVEAKTADGRVYQASSNPYGYYEIHLPKGLTNIRISDGRFPDVVFDNYKMERNYSVLNVPVCLKCNQEKSQN